jgi:methylmalonyl-CoA mutase C-terminal domain/subunit
VYCRRFAALAIPTKTKKARVLLAKSEMEAHDRGIRYVATVLRDAGFEVILIRYEIPDEVVKTAMEESVDVIGLTFYSGGVMHDTSVIMRLLKEQGMNDIAVIIGGVIPKTLIPRLKEMGIAKVVGPGDSIKKVVEFIIGKTTECIPLSRLKDR